MKYKFTFEDGSSYLMHYGVQGMKWGVWNSETRKRYSDHDVKRIAKQDARQAAKLVYKYGSSAKKKRDEHSNVIESRKRILGPEYNMAFNKYYAKQNHRKLASKSQKQLAKDLQNMPRSYKEINADIRRGQAIGGLLGATTLGTVSTITFKRGSAAVAGLLTGNAVGKQIGGIPAKRPAQKYLMSKERLDYWVD